MSGLTAIATTTVATCRPRAWPSCAATTSPIRSEASARAREAAALAWIDSALDVAVLLVHGDHHELIADRPWARAGAHGAPLPRFQRLQGYGSPHLHWVKVQIDPDAPDVFTILPMCVPAND